jgi:anti-anti-sigma factor
MKEAAMQLKVDVKERGKGVYIVMPEGHLDSNTYLMLEEKLKPLFAASTKVLIFDLSRLDYISSAGLRVVFKAKKAIKEINGSFMMANLKPQIKKVFDIINALPDIRVFMSLEEMDAYLDAMQRQEIEKQQ